MRNGNMNIKVEKKRSFKWLIISLIVLILILALGYGVYKLKSKNNLKAIDTPSVEEVVVTKPVLPEPKLQIFKGTNRPIAIMIDNEVGAWPQAGLQDAYMIYEIIIEGGQTRMMAIFKDKDPAKVGPVRSSRHYFVQYAMEQDAIYAHFGWSPKAEATIKDNNVNNVNGISYGQPNFWREGTGYHTAFTNTKNIRSIATGSKYSTTSDEKPIYDFSIKEYNLEDDKDVQNIKLTYSSSHNTSYIYDETQKVFLRSMRGTKHIDRVTKEQLYAKNIIIMQVKNYLLSSTSNKGRQELDNVGTGEGYYLTNGKAINITWKKDSLKSKTYFYDMGGKEIILNDGLTFIQVVPIGNNAVSITYKPVPVVPVSPTI